MTTPSLQALRGIALALALTCSTAAHLAHAAPATVDIASLRGAYGWEWDRIPAGTKIRILVKFDLPTLLYPEPKDGPHLASLADGAAGEYLGKYKDGWVQVRTKQGTGWIDYRLLEPALAPQ